jgi:hypothetical protein
VSPNRDRKGVGVFLALVPHSWWRSLLVAARFSTLDSTLTSLPEFMIFLTYPRHGSERRGVGPPFQPHPPQKPLV